MRLLLKEDKAIIELIEQYIPALKQYLTEHVVLQDRTDTINDMNEFLQLCEIIKDRTLSVLSILNNSPISAYTVSWVTSVSILTNAIVNIREKMAPVIEQFCVSEDDSAKVKNAVSSLFAETNEIVLRLFEDSQFLENVFLLTKTTYPFTNEVAFLFKKVFEICENNVAVEGGCIDNTELILTCASDALHQLYFILRKQNKLRRGYVLGSMFSSIVECLKAIYLSGNSQLFATLYKTGIYTPEFPVRVHRDTGIEYCDISSFYHYVAFNLTSLALESSSIEEQYAYEANLFYKCLLSLPDSDYMFLNSQEKTLQGDLLSREPSSENKAVETWMNNRFEISFMFCLNYIAMANNLEELINTPEQLRYELVSFYKNCSLNISNKLKKDSESTTTSGIGLNLLGVKKQIYTPIYPKSISSVVSNGSYNEKQVAVLRWMQLLAKQDLVQITQETLLNEDSETQISHLYEHLDPKKSAGLKKLLEVYQVINNLILLLQLKFFLKSTGSFVLDESTLNKVIPEFTTSLLQVKPLLNFDIEQVGEQQLYRFSIVKKLSALEKDPINHQIDLKKSIIDIEGIVDEDLFEG